MATPTKRTRKKPTASMHGIATRIRDMREQRGWTQHELAEKLDVKRTSVANYEQGINFPPLPILEKLAQVFGVSLDGLVWAAEAPDHAIQDRELLAFFKRIDRLNYRAKAVILEVLEAMLLKEEKDGRVKGHAA
jgi:transcriptional regulator with XRE-family HTH domain